MRTKYCSVLFSLGALVFITGCSLKTSGESISSHTLKKAVAEPEVISSMSAPGIERSIVHVTGNIYRFFNNHHSSIFLVTTEGVVFIDPLNVPAAKWVKAEIESKFDVAVTHILYSHSHQDHASGAAIFGDVEIIAHKNSFNVIKPPTDQALIHGYDAYDTNSNGVIDTPEIKGDLVETFALIDINGDGHLTGSETESFINKDVMLPTTTYDTDVYAIEIGGKPIEMHYVGGNHAADMSYIFFPEESLVFYVDIISLGTLPFGPLAWYSKQDSKNTYDVALSIDADIAVPSHGTIGTQDDVRVLRQYMTDLREGVIAGIEAGKSIEEIQETLRLAEYAHFGFYEERLPLNILGMHRTLMEERLDK